jgi:GTP-sensing pleiotropic transcriptional regulator CodY
MYRAKLKTMKDWEEELKCVISQGFPQAHQEKRTNQENEQARVTNRKTPKKYKEAANNMQKCSPNLTIKESQVRTTLSI